MQVWNAIGNFFRRLWGITLGQLIKVLAIAAVALILLLFVGLAAASLWPNSKVPLREPVHEIVYLDQGWGQGRDARERQAYYYTPQGTTIKGLRYSWFVNLERPWGSQRFADPDHMREYGFLVDLKPSAANPYQLPVGFTHHFAGEIQRRRAGPDVRRLPHRTVEHLQGRPAGRHSHRWRRSHARIHGHEAWRLSSRPDPGDDRHVRQSVQV